MGAGIRYTAIVLMAVFIFSLASSQVYGATATESEPSGGSGRVTITVSAAGDCTLGSDYRLVPWTSLLQEYERQGRDYTYFLRNVEHIFESDDLSIVNMEGPLTTVELHEDREFIFKGPPEFVKILSSSGIDAATVANNHTFDYGRDGYDETIRLLTDAGITVFGNEYTVIKEIKGMKIGLFGFGVRDAYGYNKTRISAAIEKLHENGAQLIIAYFHWGDERSNYPNDAQKEIGRFTIDSGADLVLGSHPHVMQGIEEYKGKGIVYSFGNFCYGGSRNPADKDTFIFRQTFTFENGALLPLIDFETVPVLISSVGNRNNFQPTVAEGEDAKRIWERLLTYSAGIDGGGIPE